jgi:hypothetical protein
LQSQRRDDSPPNGRQDIGLKIAALIEEGADLLFIARFAALSIGPIA